MNYVDEKKVLDLIFVSSKKSAKESFCLGAGRRAAKLVADYFKGQCGPVGGENPVLEGVTVGLYSQFPAEYFTFLDDASIQWEYYDEDNSDVKTTELLSDFEELCDTSSWFMDVPESFRKEVEKLFDCTERSVVGSLSSEQEAKITDEAVKLYEKYLKEHNIKECDVTGEEFRKILDYIMKHSSVEFSTAQKLPEDFGDISRGTNSVVNKAVSKEKAKETTADIIPTASKGKEAAKEAFAKSRRSFKK